MSPDALGWLSGECLANLAEDYRPNVSGALVDSSRGHGSDVLALRRGSPQESVVHVRFDRDLGAARADRSGDRDDLHDVGSAS